MSLADRRRKASTSERHDAKRICLSTGRGKTLKKLEGAADTRDSAKKMRLELLTKMNITTVNGKIEHQKVDAIVCAVDNSLNMAASGTVAKAVLSVGGKTLMTECKSRFPSGIKYGEVVAIGGGKLKCKKVYLTSFPDFVTEDKTDKTADTEISRKILHEVVLKIMDMVIEDGITSIALPAIGTSKMNLSVEKVAKTFFDAVETKILESGCLVEVRFVLHDQDTLQAFQNIGLERPYLSDEDAKLITDILLDAHIAIYPGLFTPTKTLREDAFTTVQQHTYEEHLLKDALFGPMLTVPYDVYDEFYQQTGLCLDGRENIRKNVTSNLKFALIKGVKLYRCIPGYTYLSIEDQVALVKSSFFEFLFLLCYKSVNTQLRVIGTYHMNDVLKIVGDEYLTELIQHANKLQDLDLSGEELVLLRCIAATFRDRCTLQDPKSVERIQLKLIQCLRCVAKKNNMNSSRRLSQILDTLTALRNLTENTYKQQMVFASWPETQRYPLLLDLLNFH